MGCCTGSNKVDTIRRDTTVKEKKPDISLKSGSSTCRKGAMPPPPPPCVLRLYLDTNRNGQVDENPANYESWQWGEDGPGGIIMVRTRDYPPGSNVDERCELRFTWDNNTPETEEGWQATLLVEPAARLRLYDGREIEAGRIDLANPMVMDEDHGVADNSQVSFWMEADGFGTTHQENSWRVTLTYRYTDPQGRHTNQTAQLRIAPWIMAGDLDPTETVFGVGPLPAAGYPAELANLAGEIFQRRNEIGGMGGAALKPFLRDVMKCGFCHSPHHQKVVIQKDLDLQSPYRNLYTAVNGTGNFRKPPGGEATSQDNGGNLLVSPPVHGYPLGRIVLGSDDNDMVCRARAFYRAQRFQNPVTIDPTWLSVGHVDEMLGFLPDAAAAANHDPWPWKILLLSPRLGYILAYAASARFQEEDPDMDQVLADAREVSGLARQSDMEWTELITLLNERFGNLRRAGGDAGAQWQDAGDPGNYDADPAPPQGQSGKVVFWQEAGNYTVQSIDSYFQRRTDDGNHDFHEVAYNMTQPRIDQARQILRQ